MMIFAETLYIYTVMIHYNYVMNYDGMYVTIVTTLL